MPDQAPPNVAAATKEAISPAKVSKAISPAANTRTQWRVVAYTYNHEDQAKEKVSQIAGRHAFLNPEVFSPKGRAPYLVTVGGPMGRNEALAFRNRARAAGLPRDTYAQNFPVNTR